VAEHKCFCEPTSRNCYCDSYGPCPPCLERERVEDFVLIKAALLDATEMLVSPDASKLDDVHRACRVALEKLSKWF
jgi:hypothetical protein